MSIASVKRVVVWGISALAIGQATGAMAQETAAAPTDDNEIVVTAAKREQSVRDVSGSVSAVSEATLQKLNAQSLSDYITRVPGVVFNDYQPGVSEVVIRGIASTTYHEANQATTGYYLNQVPLIEPGFPLVIPDVDSFDVNRVEVLRGPQGTLFGSSSLGGAVNYVVNEADPGGFDAGFEGNLSSTRRAGEVNYGAKFRTRSTQFLRNTSGAALFSKRWTSETMSSASPFSIMLNTRLKASVSIQTRP